ncbi:MAG: hypothetical protein QM767_09755 [Anaeromyxobacter sp.]
MFSFFKRMKVAPAKQVAPAEPSHEPLRCTLFVPGTPAGPAEWSDALRGRGLTLEDGRLHGEGLPFSASVRFEPNPRDGAFGHAFSFGTASEGEQQAIDAAPGALVLELPVDLHRERPAIAGLARQLEACGALAVRVEESKLGWPIARWIERVDGTDAWALYRAVVVMLKADGVAGTCGMHAFSLPDAEVALGPDLDAAEANLQLGTFNVYQLAEDPLLRSGETFSPDAEAPRRSLQRWPDARYPEGHACNNPFGVWRLGPAGSSGRPVGELAITPNPPLVVMLEAIEERQGRPLNREEVERIRDKAVSIALDPRDARELERSRGYADIDPAIAWDAWQVFRGAR